MSVKKEYLSIGEAAKRSGVAASALRFYEAEGLIEASRTAGNQRIIHRSMLRKIALIKVAQTLGLPLAEIKEHLASLPKDKTPSKQDWTKLSKRWKESLSARIHQLEQLREQLDWCIGCGCLSLKTCKLYNPNDKIEDQGSGPQLLYDSFNEKPKN